MRPAKISGADPLPLGAPPDWDEATQGPCVGLFVHREIIDGMHVMRSAHEVDFREAALLYAGAKILLGVGGTAHPVIQLGVGEIPADFEPVVHARRFNAPSGHNCVRVEMLVAAEGVHKLFSEQIIETTFAAAVAAGIEAIEILAREKGWL